MTLMVRAHQIFWITFLTLQLMADRSEALDLTTLKSWGVEVAWETEDAFRVSGTSLYAETATLSGGQTGGIYDRSFVWPAATQFRALDSLVTISPTNYRRTLRQFSDALYNEYWDNGYRSGAGASERFYDDNGHLVVSMVEAFQVTGDSTYLNRAIETYDFVISGEDDLAGGGIYFREGSQSSKDTISTLQGARAAALLYQETGESDYLDDAKRLVAWANSHVQESSGAYYQGYDIASMSPSGTPIVNATGIGISANLELFNATGDTAYLNEARRVANMSLTRFFNSSTGALNDESYWAFELVDALNDMYRTDGRALWQTYVHNALEWVHENKRDPNGHYPLFWGREGVQTEALTEWNLNEQAAITRAYLDASLAVVLPGDYNDDGIVDMADYTVWRNHLGAPANALPNDIVNRTVGKLQYSVWKSHYGETLASVSSISAITVPEPSSWVLSMLGVSIMIVARKRWR